MRIRNFLPLFLLLVIACSGGPKGDASERFMYYYESVANIIFVNSEDPVKAEEEMKAFMDKYQEDYIEVTKLVNEYPDDKKEEFFNLYGERLSEAMDVYWDTAFTPAGESEEVIKHLDNIPMFDLMAYEKFFE